MTIYFYFDNLVSFLFCLSKFVEEYISLFTVFFLVNSFFKAIERVSLFAKLNQFFLMF